MDRIDEIRARLKEWEEPLPNTWTVPVYDRQVFHRQIADDLRFLLAENERLRLAVNAAIAEYDRMLRFSCTQEQSWPEYQMCQILKEAIGGVTNDL